MKYLYNPGDTKVRANRIGHVCPNCHYQNWWAVLRLRTPGIAHYHVCDCGKLGTTKNRVYHPITEMRGTPR